MLNKKRGLGNAHLRVSGSYTRHHRKAQPIKTSCIDRNVVARHGKRQRRTPTQNREDKLDTEDRLEELKSAHGIGYCNITKCCTAVCPENITITDNAIIPLKERVVDEFFDPVRKLLRIFRPRQRTPVWLVTDSDGPQESSGLL